MSKMTARCGMFCRPRARSVRREFAWVTVVMVWAVWALCAATGVALGAESLTVIAAAAEHGANASQVLLAVAYLNGSGALVPDPARAAYWFERAAIQGNAYAEGRLGDLYAQGLGVPRNQTLAFSSAKPQLMEVLERTGCVAEIGEENIFAADDIALKELFRRLDEKTIPSAAVF